MQLKFKPVLFFVFFFLSFISYSQTARLKYADKMFDSFQFYNAVEAYLDVLERTKDSSIIAERIAISYDNIGVIDQAILWYKYLNRKGTLSKEGLFQLAYLERMNRNYDISNQCIEAYFEKYGGDEALEQLLLSDDDLNQLERDSRSFELKEVIIQSSASEMGGAFYNDQKIFVTSSQRIKNAVNKRDAWTGGYFYNLFEVPIDKQGRVVGKMEVIKGSINSKFHDGLGSYDKKNNYLYFTRDNYIKGSGVGYDDDKVVRLKIYRAKTTEKKGKIIVEEVEELPFNDDSYSCSHPSVSPDGSRLYFSSDRGGGKGKTDIYYVDIEPNGKVGHPINMGDKLNTPYNEMYPYYNHKMNRLYFASDGHKGLGGLDVFVANLDSKGNVLSIKNLGSPINTHKDDFSFVNNEEESFGYISSNRKGQDDIIRFEQSMPPYMRGSVKDIATENEIENAFMIVQASNGEILDSIFTNEIGEYGLELSSDYNDYQIRISASNYAPIKEDFTIDNNEKLIEKDYFLKPIQDYQLFVKTFDLKSDEAIAEVAIKLIFGEDTIYSGITDNLGNVVLELENYAFGDQLQVVANVNKEDYVIQDIPFETLLGEEAEVVFNVGMTLIELGETDLASLVKLDPIYFDLNSSYITQKDSKREMQEITKIMKDNPSMIIAIKGHTDQRGTHHYNVWLSERRARRAYDYLLNHGIAANRIQSVEWFSFDKPRVTQEEIDRASEEEKEPLYQLNRRTEFIVVGK